MGSAKSFTVGESKVELRLVSDSSECEPGKPNKRRFATGVADQPKEFQPATTASTTKSEAATASSTATAAAFPAADTASAHNAFPRAHIGSDCRERDPLRPGKPM